MTTNNETMNSNTMASDQMTNNSETNSHNSHTFGMSDMQEERSDYPTFHINPALLRVGTRETVPQRIVLVRHGRTSYNRLLRFQGVTDIPLDEHGLWQARMTGKALRKRYVDMKADGHQPHQLVVASDLSRARQTAQAFADPLGLTVHLDERLEERDFGEWEGVPFAEAEKKWPKAWASMAEGRGGELRHGFESVEYAGARAETAITHWAQQCGLDTTLFVFFHGSVLSIVVQQLIGLGYDGEAMAISGMHNAFWAVLRPSFVGDNHFMWNLASYNEGPVEAADLAAWDDLPR